MDLKSQSMANNKFNAVLIVNWLEIVIDSKKVNTRYCLKISDISSFVVEQRKVRKSSSDFLETTMDRYVITMNNGEKFSFCVRHNSTSQSFMKNVIETKGALNESMIKCISESNGRVVLDNTFETKIVFN